MIVEIGHFALIVALMLSLIGAVLPHLGAYRANDRMLSMSDGLAISQFLMAFIAFASLMHAYVTSDFSVLKFPETASL